MSGDGANALIPRNADVSINFFTDTPTLPASIDDVLDPNHWHLIGLLDPDAGSKESRGQSKDNKYAWGDIIYRVVRSKFVLTRTFTAIERNPITDRLDNPGGVTDGMLRVPSRYIEKVLVAFEFTEGDVKYRYITANYAEVERDGDITDKQADNSSIPFIVTVFPDPDTDDLLFRQTTQDLAFPSGS